VGDIIYIEYMDKEGWWIGISRNARGFFPYNYIEIIK
jgi:hypothetical protein